MPFLSVAVEEERGGSKVESGGVALTNCHFARLKAMMSLSLMGGPNSLGRQTRERGGNLAPYDLIRR